MSAGTCSGTWFCFFCTFVIFERGEPSGGLLFCREWRWADRPSCCYWRMDRGDPIVADLLRKGAEITPVKVKFSLGGPHPGWNWCARLLHQRVLLLAGEELAWLAFSR